MLTKIKLISIFLSFTDKNVLRVHCDLNQPSQQLTQQQITTQQVHPTRSSPPGTLSSVVSGVQSGNNNFVSEAGRFRLNANMLSSLSKLLDPPTAEGHDWRLLAERLNVHRYVTFLQQDPAPRRPFCTYGRPETERSWPYLTSSIFSEAWDVLTLLLSLNNKSIENLRQTLVNLSTVDINRQVSSLTTTIVFLRVGAFTLILAKSL